MEDKYCNNRRRAGRTTTIPLVTLDIAEECNEDGGASITFDHFGEEEIIASWPLAAINYVHQKTTKWLCCTTTSPFSGGAASGGQ